MFGSRPLIERLTQPQPTFQPQVILPLPAIETGNQPRPDVVGHLTEPATRPPTVVEAMATISGALLKSAAVDETAKELFHTWDAVRERLKNYFQSRKVTHLTELRKRDEELTQHGRELADRITALRADLGGFQGDFNVEEERRSQLQLRLQSLGPDPRRRDDWDEAFTLPTEVAQWEVRVNDARAKVEAQQAVVSGIRDRLATKEGEIAKASRELAAIKRDRKAVRSELRGEFISGPHGLRSWKVDEI